jgi:hypothetical protein
MALRFPNSEDGGFVFNVARKANEKLVDALIEVSRGID